jgi:hypothetical protein
MSAADHLNTFQLTMFERAGDLADPEKVIHGDNPYDDPVSELAGRKVRQAQNRSQVGRYDRMDDEKSLYDDIAQKGVKKPVGVSPPRSQYAEQDKPMLTDGHHRVFVSNDVNPDREIPVKWWEPPRFG